MTDRPSLGLKRSVLIVDQSAESREVLKTVLARRGVRIYEARAADEGLHLARRHQPGVIVLDLEAVPVNSQAVREGFDTQSRRHGTPMVLLGSARRVGQSFPAGQFVPKPYHYSPLIRRIEELLEEVLANDRSD